MNNPLSLTDPLGLWCFPNVPNFCNVVGTYQQGLFGSNWNEFDLLSLAATEVDVPTGRSAAIWFTDGTSIEFPEMEATYPFAWLVGQAIAVAPNNGTPETPQKTPCAVPGGSHLSIGVSGQVATVNPFTSGGGGVWGANQQSFGPTTYNYTYSGSGAGLDVGASVQSVWAYGSGSWGGPFKSISFSAGPFSGSIFWTSGKGGWTGASFGLGAGLPIPQGASEVTKHTCKSGPG